MTVRIECLTGARIAQVLGEVARLRIAVFREWPYLYDGSLAYERDYLAAFAREPDAVVVAALHEDEIVGAATAAPLGGHSAAFVPLFAAKGFDPARVFYLGESVLLPQWRGHGLGHRFFDGREAHARVCRTAGQPFTHTAFCGVVRDPQDRRKPPGYHPLDAFWATRGYAKVDGLVGSYDWLEISEARETPHQMQFWMKAL